MLGGRGLLLLFLQESGRGPEGFSAVAESPAPPFC